MASQDGNPASAPQGTGASAAEPRPPVGPRAAYGVLAAMILVWGVNWPIMKVGLRYITPMQFTAWRLVLGTVCMFGIVALAGRLRLPHKADLPVVLSVGLGHVWLVTALVNFGLLHVSAGRSAILAYTTPLWVVPLSILLLGERLGRLKLAGLLCGLLGVAALFNPLAFDWSDPDVLVGNGLLLLAAMVWAGVIVHIRGHKWRREPFDLAPWQFLIACIPAVALALALDADAPIAWSGTLAAVLLYNGPLATSFAIWAAMTVSQALPPITTSLGFLGVPVTGFVVAALALDEPLTASNVAGLVLVVTGLGLASLADRRAAGPPRAPGTA